MKSLTIRTVPFSLRSITFMLFWLQLSRLVTERSTRAENSKMHQETPYIISRKFPALTGLTDHSLRSRHWIFCPNTQVKSKALRSECAFIIFSSFFFLFFSFSNLPDAAFFLQSLRGVFYCMLKDKICIESSNFIWVKIIYKNPKTYFMKLVQTIFPAVGFCSKDHSWEILYKIKIGLDSEKYSTVLISNWEYLHKYLQWKKCYFKTLICKLTSSTL